MLCAYESKEGSQVEIMEAHVGMESRFDPSKNWLNVMSVDCLFVDGDEKAAIEQFLDGLPKCKQVRTMWYYGDDARTIVAWMLAHSKKLVKIPSEFFTSFVLQG